MSLQQEVQRAALIALIDKIILEDDPHYPYHPPEYQDYLFGDKWEAWDDSDRLERMEMKYPEYFDFLRWE